jgi:tetratricopeptide (TPR) repeat protein
MNARLSSSVLCCAIAVLVSCARQPQPQPTTVTSAAWLPTAVPIEAPPTSVRELARGAMLFGGLGDYRMPVTVSVEAEPYFEQGLRLTYAFNHDEAARSYARATEIDPSCAMCFWGAALVLGPNYNVPMLKDRAKPAWEALERARALAQNTTPVEQALISALTRRYRGPEPLDPVARQPFDIGYADAMRDVARRFPSDVDVQVLFAESMMDLDPWKLWSADGTPAPGTKEIVQTLERALSRNPMHPGANHYYIHAVEASSSPEKALPSAERLGALMPAAGHLVHMPAHIFQRVGRYADASGANERAIAADRAYLAQTNPPGYYPMYLAHNWGFLSLSSSMEGRRAQSLEAAREASKAMPPDMIAMMPGMDFFVSEPLLAMVRFGRWDELLAEPRPDRKYIVATGFWLHGHGMALASKGRLADAKRELAELVALRGETPAELRAGNNTAKDVLGLGAKILEARIATLEKSPTSASVWAEAVMLGDHLSYSEPDDWFYPVRHYQGAALLDAGNPVLAEAVYREDLRRHPNNGWALFGVWRALVAQKRSLEVPAARAAFEKAWSRADFTLTSTAL